MNAIRLRLLALLLPALLLPAVAQAQTGYDHAWTSDTGDWNYGVVVAPWGDVVSISSRSVRVHARDTGKVVDSSKLEGFDNGSAVRRGFWFISDTRAVQVTDKVIRYVDFPGLTSTVVAKVDDAETAAVSGMKLAVATDAGKVFVYDLANEAKIIDEFDVHQDVDSMALSPDGKLLAVGVDKGTVFLRRGGKNEVLRTGGSSNVGALRFSPDGRVLFAEGATFKASTFDPKTGKPLDHWKCGSWINQVAFGQGFLAVAGSDGMQIYVAGGKTIALPTPGRFGSGESIDFSAKEGLLCAGNRDGHIVCFASGKLAPSTYQKPSETLIPPQASGAGKPREVTAKVTRKRGKRVTLETAGGDAPPVNTRVVVFRHLEQRFGNITTSTWLEVAVGSITKVKGGQVEMEVLSESSEVRINGKKVQHVARGSSLKLTWLGPN